MVFVYFLFFGGGCCCLLYIYLFVCLFVYLFVCFYFLFSWVLLWFFWGGEGGGDYYVFFFFLSFLSFLFSSVCCDKVCDVKWSIFLSCIFAKGKCVFYTYDFNINSRTCPLFCYSKFLHVVVVSSTHEVHELM